MLMQRNVISFIVIVIVSVEYFSECNGYHLLPPSYNKLTRFKRQLACRAQFDCNSGECINTYLVCDGEGNCPDGSDEVYDLCNAIACQGSSFRCAYGACVDGDAKCDGKKDCIDNSDEDVKICGGGETTTTESAPEPDGGCHAPVIENGKYEILGNGEYVQGDPVPNFGILNFTCNSEIYALTTINNLVNCINGKFQSKVPKCVLTCAPRFSTSIDVECELNGVKQDCTKKAPEGTIAIMKCKTHYVESVRELSIAVCFGGSWNVPPKQCFPERGALGSLNASTIRGGPVSSLSRADMCPARSSNAIDIFCEFNGVAQDCNKEVPEGTISHMRCKKNYVDVNNAPTIALCSNGNWSEPPLKCIPDCGQIHQEGQTYIVNGTSASRNDFPWHVAIYKQKSQGLVDYICGGSIISVKVVITAAHCVTNANNGDLYPASEYKVAAGKKYSKWDEPEDEYYVQKKNVIEMYTPRDIFFGHASNYYGDVAVVVVDKIFTFTNFIKPICVDWNSEYIIQQLKDGNLGKLAGFGADTTGNQLASVNLKQLAIPFVRRDKCLEIVPKNFKSFVTADKFCAGYTNGSSVCSGDSGGGIAFPYSNQNGEKTFFLQGIVSAGPLVDGHCDTHQLGVYTQISNYVGFIRDIEESNRV